ncbi:patatin-like phospholipase family protein [Legionella jordanis]|uniref:Alpha-beta hydrolase family transporter esterase n=1 Tax=Legionella jordanis TaxID=456 RepID=A0A0W0VD97_9GAMM|nr:patatin-like phospholipase family protein [Legionella jordanis]KTD18107.1 alpha-beta hydrolase family transporter esterase [Legionella jordanis]RMX00580.1 patatin [Legionella jordanis]RMX21304.1 patatin [Legionella jordanis]VEH13800.1 patatin family protein [Legionella jordanis]HAT8714182.1 patatin [Legionella jordanis]
MAKKGVYLAGGGARGAYQAGVLKAIHHILQTKTIPFEMISGVSVGSINAAVLAENAHDFRAAVEKMENMWSEISCQQIFNASNYELSKSVLRNLSNLIIKQRQTGHLLDTTPLREYITDNIDFDLIRINIACNHFETMEVISQCYETQQTISFYQHCRNDDFVDWHYPRHISQRASLGMEHILASSALPLFFPTVHLDGFHYGDGSMGLVSPLRGAIRFQVEKILILGTRQLPIFTNPEHLKNGDIGFARILGGMLNGIFLDNLDRDIEMVNHMNDIARLLSMWKKRRSPWRPIDTLHLRPSVDLSQMAQAQYNNMPALLRFLLNVLGAKDHSGDLLSFLLFEKEFTRELIELGFQDTLSVAEDVEKFFS